MDDTFLKNNHLWWMTKGFQPASIQSQSQMPANGTLLVFHGFKAIAKINVNKRQTVIKAGYKNNIALDCLILGINSKLYFKYMYKQNTYIKGESFMSTTYIT